MLLLVVVSDSPGIVLAVYAAGGGNKSKTGGDFSFCDVSTILDVEDGGEGGAKYNGSLKSKSGGGFKNEHGTFSSILFEQLDEQSISLSGVASPRELIECFLLDNSECLFLRNNRLCLLFNSLYPFLPG